MMYDYALIILYEMAKKLKLHIVQVVKGNNTYLNYKSSSIIRTPIHWGSHSSAAKPIVDGKSGAHRPIGLDTKPMIGAGLS